MASGYGGMSHLCSVGITFTPKFSSKGCINVENADYKICSLESYKSDMTDGFTKSAIFTDGTNEFMLSFVVNIEKDQLSKEQFEKKYEVIYNAIFDSVNILN